MSELWLCCHAFIAATEWHMGRWQLAFVCLVFIFSLMLLPGLWYRHDCLSSYKAIRCEEFGFHLTLEWATDIKVSKSRCN